MFRVPPARPWVYTPPLAFTPPLRSLILFIITTIQMISYRAQPTLRTEIQDLFATFDLLLHSSKPQRYTSSSVHLPHSKQETEIRQGVITKTCIEYSDCM